MDRFNYIVPGIFDGVDDPHMWDYQAQLWFYRNGLGLSAGFNYFADVIGGNLARGSQAAQVASDLKKARRAGLSPIVAVGQSNGCGILCLALKNFPGVFIQEVHLIAAAVNRDCDTNGLNAAAANGQVGKVVAYVSAADQVLGLGPWVSYGELGKKGPVNMSPALAAIYRQVDRDCGHMDWVERDLLLTLDLIAPHGGNG